MSDDSVPRTLLAVGIVSIIIASIIIVWLIICCEKRRRATFRFKPGQGSTVYRNPSYMVKDPTPEIQESHIFPEYPTYSDSEADTIIDIANYLDIPIHQQIVAILGSFPDINDYKPLDFGDSESGDEFESDSASLIAKDSSKCPSIVKASSSSNNINSSMTEMNVNVEINTETIANGSKIPKQAKQSQTQSDTDSNKNSTTNSHSLSQTNNIHPEDKNIYNYNGDTETESICTSAGALSRKINNDVVNGNNKASILMLETTI